MIFSVFLSAVFLFMAVYSFVFIPRRDLKLVLTLAYAVGMFFVWNPQTTHEIANFFGVGRGLDFFLILLSVTIVNALVLLARHMNAQHRALTQLARHVALHEARAQPQQPE
jgi:hypothetical protein